ncbi:hypothetical protein SCHPADRAFT_836241 [Schizopora paradoxa]|uniref:DUF1793-domain-containing protein n=1 Tax=Schizopora paradoxa TaxID=27342 RepID=A0A0H2R7B6_9AGAM|nr:hypothetical protein SCHPADRAFT_836241 [Schizopora paradoxa]
MTRKREILLNFLSTALFSFIILVAPVRVIAQQLLAPAWPLAVKNPFLNTWYQAGPNLLPLGEVWPNFWDPSITGWYCDALVDGVHYHLMGEDYFMLSKPVKQSSVRVTPTRTIIEVVAGPVNISMTFLTPITASDFTRQSLPFSYFLVTVVSADDSQHSVKFYSDISAEWATGDTSFTANSAVETDIDFVILQTSLKAPVPFAEISEHAQDSVALYAIKNGPGINYEVGEDEVVRSASLNSTAGGLQNNVDPNISSHPIDSPFDVWGISVDLGNVTSTTTSPAVWAIAVTRDPSIQFATLSGIVQLRNSYYRMNFSTPHDMVSFFLNDFENALNASIQLDLQITNDAATISTEYVDLLSLVSRQAMSALEITVSKDASGNFNASDVMIFLKDMGSVSEGGVNAVDVLYAAFPIYLYLNPDIGGHLLKPLLQSQDVPQYSQPFATQGLGTNYPNATISNLPHDSGIEQSGNMIIMLLAHLQSSGDSSLIRQHYSLIKKWADYLVQISLSPGMQCPSFSDGIFSVNQTNVALKGILGIAAMAKLSSSMGIDSDASNYESVAESYIGQWQNLSLSSDKTYLLTSFGQDASAGLIYNMYVDKLLKLDLIPQSVYDLQTTYYKSQLGRSRKASFLCSSESSSLTKFGSSILDWMFFAGAASGDEDLQRSLISLVHYYVFTPSEVTPLSTVYDPTTGISIAGSNRCSSHRSSSLLKRY